MKQRPILFQGAMVRALLDGSKTQTRRIVNERSMRLLGAAALAGECHALGSVDPISGKDQATYVQFSPYGQPGDQLWVRETWGRFNGCGTLAYRATNDDSPMGSPERWKPSIHMPRAASRITLEITSVRVERLQDISAADAKAEGLIRYREKGIVPDLYSNGATDGFIFPVDAYSALWEQINGPGSWDANPWVWVVSFRTINVKGSK